MVIDEDYTTPAGKITHPDYLSGYCTSTVVEAETVDVPVVSHRALKTVVVESWPESAVPLGVEEPICMPPGSVTVHAVVPTELHEISDVLPLVTDVGFAMMETTACVEVALVDVAVEGAIGCGSGCGIGCTAFWYGGC
jgi:hypothetical protein